MIYPEEAIVSDSRGKREARILRSLGKDFVVYGYADLESGKKLDKYSVLLRKEGGQIEHLFIIRLPKGKELVVKHESEKEPKRRGIFDEAEGELVYF